MTAQFNPLFLDSEQAKSHLAAIVESSDDAIISKTPEGIVLTWNSGAERIYGYPAQEAKGRQMTFLLPPERYDEESAILERINSGQRVEHYETVRQRKDGRQIHVSLSIFPIRDGAGRIVAISHIARDITERKHAEAAIRESETKLRTFLESASQGVIAVDAGGRIELVNAKLEEMFGYTRDEILGRKLELLIPERCRSVHTGHRGQYFAHPRPRSMGAGLNLAGLRKDGSEFPLEIALSFVPSQSGPLAIAFVSDITERRRFEEQLRQTQKLESVGVLAGGVAHDFNNLLTGILGNASLLLDATEDGHTSREALMNIIDASERAAHLTRQLLAYAGKGKLVVERVDISELVRAISRLIQMSIPKSVQLRLHLTEPLPAVEADLSQIQQVIMNLIINGAEAIGEDTPGTVTVTTGVQQIDDEVLSTLPNPGQIAPGTYVNVEVHDTGCGMDEGTMSRIFDPFFTTKFTGRGLGLAAVQGIVRGHKGIIRLKSEPGHGTTFKLLFPATGAESPPEAFAPPKKNLSATSPGTVILVIDDEALVRNTAKASLEHYGYKVVVAEDGKQGLELYRLLADKISLVLLDLMMPVMGGEAALKEIKQIRPDVKVILTSGYTQAEAVRRFTDKGLAGFIQKPFTAEALARVAQSALDPARYIPTPVPDTPSRPSSQTPPSAPS